MSRYNRGVSSAIDFATAEELSRAPPEPPQPPPPAPGARGEWRWVWVPEQADVRDRPAGDSEPTSASRPRLTSSSVAPVPRRSDRSSAETPTGVWKAGAHGTRLVLWRDVHLIGQQHHLAQRAKAAIHLDW